MSTVSSPARLTGALLGVCWLAVALVACGQPGQGPAAESAPGTVTATVTESGAEQNTGTEFGICPTGNLDVAVLAQQGAAGSVIYALGFTNTSQTSCGLSGFPGVSFVVGVDGPQIGAAAVREGMAITQLLPLEPGGSVQAELRVSRAELHDPAACGEVIEVGGLRIYPPGNTESVFLPLVDLTGCASETVELLTVYPVTATGQVLRGRGVPRAG